MPLVAKQKNLQKILNQLNVVSLAFLFFVALFLGIGQAWKLQPPDVIQSQWIVFGISSLIFLAIFTLSHKKKSKPSYYYILILGQIINYIVFVSYIIYAQRGMASPAVILYVIPVLFAAATRASWAVITTAFITGISYCLSVYKYFSDFPSEGYKAEMYGRMLFYFLILMLVSRIIHVLISNKDS